MSIFTKISLGISNGIPLKYLSYNLYKFNNNKNVNSYNLLLYEDNNIECYLRRYNPNSHYKVRFNETRYLSECYYILDGRFVEYRYILNYPKNDIKCINIKKLEKEIRNVKYKYEICHVKNIHNNYGNVLHLYSKKLY